MRVTQTPTVLNDKPIFEFFAQTPMGIHGGSIYQPSKTLVGNLESIADVDKLLPASQWRIEIERWGGHEEIRVINDYTGDYHAAEGSKAIPIITEIDRRTTDLYSSISDGLPIFPGGGPTEAQEEFWNSLIMYDHEGHRVLPALIHVGNINTWEEWEEACTRPTGMTFVGGNFCAVCDRRTGEVWWASEDVTKREKERMEANPC
ncbi:hypothetical protein V866_007267 [Kwoniella sp. B9012]